MATEPNKLIGHPRPAERAGPADQGSLAERVGSADQPSGVERAGPADHPPLAKTHGRTDRFAQSRRDARADRIVHLEPATHVEAADDIGLADRAQGEAHAGGGAPVEAARSAERGGVLERARPIERVCYLIGSVLLASGLFHAALLITSGGTWEGPISWRKPMTFGLSFGLTLITIAWVASHLRLRGRSRRLLLGVFAAACVTEVALITLQAWRQVPSHFNMETSLDAAISRVLAAGGGVLIVTLVTLTVVSWRPLPGVAPSMRLALRAGFLALDTALLIGAVMVTIAMLDVLRGDQVAAYAVGAHWKPAHFVPMHGILALPLLAWLLARTPLPEHSRVHTVALATTGYGILCALAVVESTAGIDPLSAPLLADSIAALATAAIVAAAARTLALLRGRPTDRPVSGLGRA